MEPFSIIAIYAQTILIFIYVILTYSILKSNNQILVEQTRPYVTAKLLERGLTIHLFIKNVGQRPAKDVVVQFLPSLDTISQERWDKTFWDRFQNQSFLGSNDEINNPINMTPILINKNKGNIVFDVTINYSDISGKYSYNDKYRIDFNSILISNRAINKDNSYYIESISKSLDKIYECLAKTIKK